MLESIFVKVSKSGHVHRHRNRPTTAPLRHPTPKQASGSKRAIKWGRGALPRLASGLSRESLDPPPGTGREPTSQVLTCGGPNGTTYR